MPLPKQLPLAPPGSRAVPIAAQCLDRLDAICVFLKAIHGKAWVTRTARDTGISAGQLYHYSRGRAIPPLLRLAALEAYAIEEGFVSTNPALKKILRRQTRDHPEVSENRKKYFLTEIKPRGAAVIRLLKRLEASLKSP